MERAWVGDAELVQLVERTFRAKRPAAVTAITPGRELTATIGVADHSTFEIGSISKAITGMLYSDAIVRGLVSPATTLRELLPLQHHGEVGAVTLGSLATHRSGLPSLPPRMHLLRRSFDLLVRGENPYGDSLDELLDQTRNMRLDDPRPRYSNLGFQLLGHAVAAASGRSYERLLKEVMGDGFSAPALAEDLGLADLTGFSRSGRPLPAWVGEAVGPAGGIRASVTTMRHFLRSSLDGTARGVAALEPVADFAPRVRIGAGWITLTHRGRTITWHNGSTGGFSSWIGLDRDAGVGVVVLLARHGSVDRRGFRLLTALTAPGGVPPAGIGATAA